MTGPTSIPAAETPAAPRRVHSARHLVSRAQVAASFRMHHPGFPIGVLWIVGVQAALASAVALSLVHFSSFDHLIGFAGLGALVATFGGARTIGDRLRVLVGATICQLLSVFVFSLLAMLHVPMLAGWILLALATGLYAYVCLGRGFGPPGPLIFMFGAAASLGDGQGVLTLADVGVRTGVTAGAAILSIAILLLLERRRYRLLSVSPPPPPPKLGSHALWRTVAWVTASAGIAMVAASALGLAYPAWAGMGAVVVAQNRLLHVAASRTFERALGGLIGALLAWAILSLSPQVPVLIAVIALAMVLTEGVIWRNYALGQIFVTLMALLMVYLASHGAVDAWMPLVRIADTLLGVSIGIVVTLLMSTAQDRRHLHDHHRARVDARANKGG